MDRYVCLCVSPSLYICIYMYIYIELIPIYMYKYMVKAELSWAPFAALRSATKPSFGQIGL